MPKPNNSKSQQIWNHQDQQRFSLEDFLTFLQEQLAIITTEREHLQSAYSLLKENRRIAQDQWNYIIDRVHSMDQPVQDLSLLLEKRNCLPVALLPLRHQLTNDLLMIKDLLCTVLALIGSFISIHKTGIKECATIRYKIVQKLDILLHESENIAHLSQTLSDQAHFQEKRNAAFLDSVSSLRDEHRYEDPDRKIDDISLYRKKRDGLLRTSLYPSIVL